MTDTEIYELCSTKKGIIKYIKEVIDSNSGYYNWAYLDYKEVPLLIELINDGVVIGRHCKSGVYEYTLSDMVNSND